MNAWHWTPAHTEPSDVFVGDDWDPMDGRATYSPGIPYQGPDLDWRNYNVYVDPVERSRRSANLYRHKRVR